MDQAFLFLYRKIAQTSVFSSKKIHKLGCRCFRKNKTSDGRSIGQSIHDDPQKIQTGMSWVAHVKKEA